MTNKFTKPSSVNTSGDKVFINNILFHLHVLSTFYVYYFMYFAAFFSASN